MPPTPAPLRRAVLPLIAALVAPGVLAACGSVASPVPSSPAASASAPPSVAGTPSESPTERPTPTPTASPTPSPTPTPTPTPTPPPLQGLALEPVADGLENPLDVKARPGDGVLFVAEQRGRIKRIEDGTVAPEPFLDIADEVNVSSIEQGLLGFAFHPDYPADPRVFVFHSKFDNDNVLVSYETTGDPDVLDPASREELLTVDKEPEQVRHNGGTVLFGPDGLLYLSLGDGARASINGQDPSTLPATILRLDVDGEEPYAIPQGNPFAEGGNAPEGVEGRPEVWWFGLRNPWRFTIDEPTGMAWIADVGQETWEEINVVPLESGGLNFGWPSLEGTDVFYSGIPAVSETTGPVVTVRHDDTDRGCSITGGVVYRGAAIPELDGHYLYADWCYGWIRSLRLDGTTVTDEQDWSESLETVMVSSFGVDGDGEVLVLDYELDTMSRIVPVR